MAEVARRAGILAAYRRLLAAQIRAQTQYRTSFALDLLLNAMISALELVAVLAVFRVTPQLAGFPLRQALLIASTAQFAFCLADVVVGNIERLPTYLRTGQLDAVLLRPLSALGQLLVTDASMRRLGRVAQSGAVYGIALVLAPIHWTVARTLLAVVAPAAGAVIYGGVFVTGAAAMFWLIDGGEVVNAFTYGGRDFGSYPASIYAGWLRRLLGYGVGLAAVGYLPALGLLGRADPLGLPVWVRWASPLVAGAWVVVARLAWRHGVRHYQGTGS